MSCFTFFGCFTNAKPRLETNSFVDFALLMIQPTSLVILFLFVSSSHAALSFPSPFLAQMYDIALPIFLFLTLSKVHAKHGLPTSGPAVMFASTADVKALHTLLDTAYDNNAVAFLRQVLNVVAPSISPFDPRRLPDLLRLFSITPILLLFADSTEFGFRTTCPCAIAFTLHPPSSDKAPLLLAMFLFHISQRLPPRTIQGFTWMMQSTDTFGVLLVSEPLDVIAHVFRPSLPPAQVYKHLSSAMYDRLSLTTPADVLQATTTLHNKASALAIL
ncbi:hypothetical protein PLEOSDRAFT_162505 [Pleurotus ostreatus PC15]|uniref:Uncharacterized protein n=1 Tax=Pleurotus ostreatus (strain PC15) TaxID=1137138 RepID=A0A067NH74_PLEO1|nr:hypothetical protein PLEOSDRAFT_162505 [Pleurotus ostreatus PC15]